MLPNYFIICRSLTHAQRTASVLERAGIPAPIQRAPRGAVEEEGCTHAVRVREHQLSRALVLLGRAGLPPSRVLLTTPEGTFQEVAL